jgi:CheY-like chemotaxis protein
MVTVLVIDDNHEVRGLVRAVLEPACFGVVKAADGRDGLAAALAASPAVVLCDIHMPARDGLEAIRVLRGGLPGVAIVALSGGDGLLRGLDVLGMAERLGAGRVLAKPFRAAELVTAVTAALAETKK